MKFKFLQTNEYLNLLTDERTIEYNTLTTDNRPAVFLRLERNRSEISDREWEIINMNQRRKLIENMHNQSMIIHEIISEDDSGFTVRTEINF